MPTDTTRGTAFAARPGTTPARAPRRKVDATCRVLATLLLEPNDRLFVRALVGEGTRARHAWTGWSHEGGWTDPHTTRGRLVKAFAPLVLEAARDHHFALERTAAATLRAWRLAESGRTRRYHDVLGDVLARLSARDVQPLLVGGAALSATLYADPSHRHCHDIDLLVRGSDVERSVTALDAAGFVRVASGDGNACVRMVHASQLSLVVRCGVLDAVSNRAIPFDELFTSCETAQVAGHETAVLSRAHALVCTCLPALTMRHRVESARALLDIWRLVIARPAVDWPQAVDIAVRQELALPLAAALRFLADESGTPPPGGVLDVLASAVAPSLARDRSRVLPTLAGAPRSLGALVCLPCSWQAKIAVGLTMLLPAAEHVRPTTGGTGRLTLGMHHARRIVRWLSRRTATDSPAGST